MPAGDLQQTLVLIKPDALRNSLSGYVLSQLSEFHTGLWFAGAKIVHVTRILAEEHYAEHKGKPFFPAIIAYIMGRSHYPNDMRRQRVIALVYQGPDAIKKIRALAGPTDPLTARNEKPGCIRSLGTIAPVKDENGNVVGQRMDNLIHASANEDDAEREIKLWFRPADIPPLMHCYPTRECKEHYYCKDGLLTTTHEPGSVCLFAPGDIAWLSDLETLEAIHAGRPSERPLEAVVAKYFINQFPETE